MANLVHKLKRLSLDSLAADRRAVWGAQRRRATQRTLLAPDLRGSHANATQKVR
jgi:hypothetical protein